MESRLTVRVPIALKIVSRIEDMGETKVTLAAGNSFEVNALDISETGISLASQFFLPKQLLVQLTFDGNIFGMTGSVSVRGQVRHCRNLKTSGYKIGIQFIDMPDDLRKSVSAFIASHGSR